MAGSGCAGASPGMTNRLPGHGPAPSGERWPEAPGGDDRASRTVLENAPSSPVTLTGPFPRKALASKPRSGERCSIPRRLTARLSVFGEDPRAGTEQASAHTQQRHWRRSGCRVSAAGWAAVGSAGPRPLP